MNSTIALTRRALKEEWPVTNKNRAKAVDAVIAIFDDEEVEIKDKMMAARTLAIMDKLNVEREGNVIKSQPKHIIHHKDLSNEQLKERLIDRLAEMGITEIPANALPFLEQEKFNGDESESSD